MRIKATLHNGGKWPLKVEVEMQGDGKHGTWFFVDIPMPHHLQRIFEPPANLALNFDNDETFPILVVGDRANDDEAIRRAGYGFTKIEE